MGIKVWDAYGVVVKKRSSPFHNGEPPNIKTN